MGSLSYQHFSREAGSLWKPVYGPRIIVVVIILILGFFAPLKQSPAKDEKKPLKSASKEQKKIVAGWLPYWDTQTGKSSITEFPGSFTEISPFWYTLAEDGNISVPNGSEDIDLLEAIRNQDQKVIPTISSPDEGVAGTVLNDAEKRQFHINSIVSKIDEFQYDGIDIDYENLAASDRETFNTFIKELSAAIHSHKKKLVVTVNAKTAEPGGWYGAQSHDYAAIAEAADYVRIMAYDQHYRDSEPGPIASITWVEEVIAFSLSKIPKEKLVLGLPTYGYDWTGSGSAKSIVFDNIPKDRPMGWDDASASPFLTYWHEGIFHQIWFENSRSLEAKIDLVQKYDLAGIVLWRLGREDKTTYPMIQKKLLAN